MAAPGDGMHHSGVDLVKHAHATGVSTCVQLWIRTPVLGDAYHGQGTALAQPQPAHPSSPPLHACLGTMIAAGVCLCTRDGVRVATPCSSTA